MSCCDETPDTPPGCTCQALVHPKVISNPAGLTSISYLVGDYLSFREAMLRPRDGETQLTQTVAGTNRVVQLWHPTAEGDLALQLVEWAAYIWHIIAFYNQRTATQAYLRTADLPESVTRLVNLLGYRPRPGIGAKATIAALLSSPKTITLPKGFQVQDKPGPGRQPQIFELDQDTSIGPPDVIGLVAPPASDLIGPSANSVVLKGSISGIKPGDQLLLTTQPQASSDNFFWLSVQQITGEKDANGAATTRISFSKLDVFDLGDASNYRLLKRTQTTRPWTAGTTSPAFPTTDATIGSLGYHFTNVTRQMTAGDPILFLSGTVAQLANVLTYGEEIWYADGAGKTPNSDVKIPAVPILHSFVTLDIAPDVSAGAAAITVLFGWLPVGQLMNDPVGAPSSFQLYPGNFGSSISLPDNPAGEPVLVQDASANAASATMSISSNELSFGKIVPDGQTFTAPVQVFPNVLSISRGKTVAGEVLGVGNARADQDFTLANSPVTYTSVTNGKSGFQYSSTVRVWVNDVEWTEVPTFYGQSATALIFVTREDELVKTHVRFGSGEFGAMPGTNSTIRCSYRFGSGGALPIPGALNVILQPQPGLKSLVNPIPPIGGADPDPPDQIRLLAPRSVRTFGRAISADDFEIIAASTPGVDRAKSAVEFDGRSQRPRITIWVGDSNGAVAAATGALQGACDPNRPPLIKLATARNVAVNIVITVDPRVDSQPVLDAVKAAMTDPVTGLFATANLSIGQAIFDSQIYAACLKIPGVIAALPGAGGLFQDFSGSSKGGGGACGNHRHDPGPGGFFALADGDCTITGGS